MAYQANTPQVDNRGSLENVGSKWVAEITEHCPGVKVVLCALKCDLREEHEKEDDDHSVQPLIQYNEGLEVARKIGALRYLGMSTYEGTKAPLCHHKADKTRMLSNAQPGRQRGIHRSGEGGAASETCEE